MRMSKVPLVLLGEHLINLTFLTNAFVEKYDSYPVKWRLRYFVDNTTSQEDENGNLGMYVEFASKKAAMEALANLVVASDTLIIEGDES